MPRTIRQSAAFTDQAHLFCGRFPKLRQSLSECKIESDGSEGHGQRICDRLRQIYGEGLIAREQMRHQIDQRQQQNEFPDNGRDGGHERVADGDEGHLAGHLDAEDKEDGQIGAQGRNRKINQRRIAGK